MKKPLYESYEIHKVDVDLTVRRLMESVNADDETPGQALEEGILTGIAGGIAGATLGPALMKSICKILGISEKGPLGSLLTSKLVLSAIGAEIGYKF